MTSMDRTAPGRAATRALAVLAVLLGLVAMHGLASTHHAAAATAVRGAAQHQAEPTAPKHPQHAAVPAIEKAAAAVAGPEGPACGDDCTDLAVLCVAVLTGVMLGALLLAGRRAALLPAPPRHGHAALRAPPVRHVRGPDLVKELCVSRT